MQIWIDNHHPKGLVPDEEVQRVVESVLLALDLSQAEVSIVLVDDREISRMNRQYLQRQGPTNVIAFSMREGEGAQVSPDLLGDVVVSLDTARREASEAGIPWEGRLAELLVHGILHLLGHDHEGEGTQARKMEAEEQRIMEVLKGEERLWAAANNTSSDS